jgi:choline dehydrogenase-like flavoprotein
VRTLNTYAHALARELERLGLGAVRLADAPDFSRRGGLGATRDIFHHMGTTRMSESAVDGVTDANLKCHDLDNVYIASTSVFPTGGIANPTFTLVALALRLADRLQA